MDNSVLLTNFNSKQKTIAISSIVFLTAVIIGKWLYNSRSRRTKRTKRGSLSNVPLSTMYQSLQHSVILAISSLPTEIILQIFANGSESDLSKISQVCKNWNQMVMTEDALWKQTFAKRWPSKSLAIELPRTMTWRDYYIQNSTYGDCIGYSVDHEEPKVPFGSS
jgi:hypothetical protein